MNAIKQEAEWINITLQSHKRSPLCILKALHLTKLDNHEIWLNELSRSKFDFFRSNSTKCIYMQRDIKSKQVFARFEKMKSTLFAQSLFISFRLFNSNAYFIWESLTIFFQKAEAPAVFFAGFPLEHSQCCTIWLSFMDENYRLIFRLSLILPRIINVLAVFNFIGLNQYKKTIFFIFILDWFSWLQSQILYS